MYPTPICCGCTTYVTGTYPRLYYIHTDTDGAILGSLGPTPFFTTDRMLGHGIPTTDIDTQRDRQAGRQADRTTPRKIGLLYPLYS